jgi:hypothetical protein
VIAVDTLLEPGILPRIRPLQSSADHRNGPSPGGNGRAMGCSVDSGCQPRDDDVIGAYEFFRHLHGETAPCPRGGTRSNNGHRRLAEERDVTRCVEQTPDGQIAKNRDL